MTDNIFFYQSQITIMFNKKKNIALNVENMNKIKICDKIKVICHASTTEYLKGQFHL